VSLVNNDKGTAMTRGENFIVMVLDCIIKQVYIYSQGMGVSNTPAPVLFRWWKIIVISQCPAPVTCNLMHFKNARAYFETLARKGV